MRNHMTRGLVAGFLATGILSICMLIKGAAGIVPQAQAIQALLKVGALWLSAPLAPWIGWLEHFFIGTVLWGLSFAVFDQLTAVLEQMMPNLSVSRFVLTTAKGFVFSIGAWILMMVLLMPPAGAGWFAANLGYGAPLAALVLHIIYGTALGAIYGALTPAGERVPRHHSPALADGGTFPPREEAAGSNVKERAGHG